MPAGNDTYTIASGADLWAGGDAPLPSWLSSAASNEWVAVPGSVASTATSLYPADGYNVTAAAAGLIHPWNGASCDKRRLYLHGGGHADYHGNEIAVIDIRAESPAYSLLVERSAIADVRTDSNYYADGLPTSRHTYYSVWHVPQINKLLRFNAYSGMAYNGANNGGAGFDGPSARTKLIDAFDLNTNTWGPAEYGPTLEIFGSETSMCGDTSTGDVYALSTYNDLYKWARESNATTLALASAGSEGGGAAIVYDAATNSVFRFAGHAGGTVAKFDLTAGAKSAPTLSGPDAADLSGLTGDNYGWGIAHDPARRVAWLMSATSAQVWRIDLATMYVARLVTTGATPTVATNQVWSRLKYLSDLDAIVYLSKASEPILAMRCA